MDELRKIDLIRERMDVSYGGAREALERADGDVVAALIDLEQRQCSGQQQPEERGHKLWAGIKELVHQTHETKIRVIKDGETLLKIPATVGIAVLLGVLSNNELAIAAGIGTAAAILKGYHMELERQQEQAKDDLLIIS